MRLMRLQDFYPIVVTEHLAACRDFYGRWFDLDIVFQASWCVLLGARESRGSLAFMHPDHPRRRRAPSRSTARGSASSFRWPTHGLHTLDSSRVGRR